MSRFQFVADHQDTFEVKQLCQGVKVGRSSFYAWLAGAQARAQRQADDDALAERIRQVHQADRAYGAPRVTAELNDPASPINALAAGDTGAGLPHPSQVHADLTVQPGPGRCAAVGHGVVRAPAGALLGPGRAVRHPVSAATSST